MVVYFSQSRALAKGMPWLGTYVRPQLPSKAADGLFPGGRPYEQNEKSQVPRDTTYHSRTVTHLIRGTGNAVTMRSMRGGFVFRNRGPLLNVHWLFMFLQDVLLK